MPTPGALADVLAALSADEMVAALGLARAPAPLRLLARAAFLRISAPLGAVLARFDACTAAEGPARASASALAELGARWAREGEAPPPRGPLLVVANHPGAYDALTLLSALGRDDVAIVAADRSFLRALPAFARHLVFLPEPPAPASARARGLRAALRHLRRGGALVQFGAGRIEPDPAFPRRPDAALLAPWPAGTALLLRGAAWVGGQAVGALVSGVHSPRAKRLPITRWAETRGVTTLAPLLQVALPWFHDVRATVRFGAAVDARDLAGRGDDATITGALRSQVLALVPR